MLRKITDALRRFMYGRYGSDQLGIALLVTGFVVMLLGALLWKGFVWIAYAILIFYIFRVYSKNIPQRRKENSAFLRLIAPLKDRDHRYFRCPNCRQSVRVPRGKGKLSITCPKCRKRFEKKS